MVESDCEPGCSGHTPKSRSSQACGNMTDVHQTPRRHQEKTERCQTRLIYHSNTLVGVSRESDFELFFALGSGGSASFEGAGLVRTMRLCLMRQARATRAHAHGRPCKSNRGASALVDHFGVRHLLLLLVVLGCFLCTFGLLAGTSRRLSVEHLLSLRRDGLVAVDGSCWCG